MPSAIEELLEQIQELNDLKIIEGKRTYRKGLITKVMKKIDAIERKPLRNASLSDVTRHLGEMEQAARLFEALQDRYEEVLSAIPDSDIEGEQAKGELTKQEHQDFIERVVDLKVRLNHYHEGLTLRDTIEAIFDSEILNVPAIISRISQVEKLTQSFRSNTIDYAEDETISPVRQAIHGDLKSLFKRLAAEQKATAKDSLEESTSIPTSGVIVKSNTSRLKVSLPKFDGSPLEWRRFHDLFTTVIEKDDTLREPEKACLLLEAMSNSEAQEVVKAASTGDNCYVQAMNDLRQKYGCPRTIYREHLQVLMKKHTFGYNQSDLTTILETWTTHIRGLKDSKGYEATNLLATLLENQFDRELAHQWALATVKLEEPSTMEDLLDFVKTRIHTALPLEPVRKLTSCAGPPKKSNSSLPSKSSKPVYKVTPNPVFKCCVCKKEGHGLGKCPTFLEWDQARRHKAVKENKHCYNCLGHSHGSKDCQSSFNCRMCNGRHHTLLHRDTPAPDPSSTDVTASPAHVSTPPAALQLMVHTNVMPEHFWTRVLLSHL